MSKPTKLDIIWASSGALVDPGDAKFQLGWESEIPPYQWFNYVMNKTSQMLDHINSRGLPEWDALTPYSHGARVIYGLTLYVCHSANSVGDIPSSSSSWYAIENELENKVNSYEEPIIDNRIKSEANEASIVANIDQQVKTTSNVTFAAAIAQGVYTNNIYEKTASAGITFHSEAVFNEKVVCTERVRFKHNYLSYAKQGSEIFTVLSAWVPNTDDVIPCTGIFQTTPGDIPYYILGIRRLSSTVIHIMSTQVTGTSIGQYTLASSGTAYYNIFDIMANNEKLNVV